jgi:TolB protein
MSYPFFMKNQFTRRSILMGAASSACLSGVAWAQFRVEIAGVGVVQLPLMVVPFRVEGILVPTGAQKPSAIVGTDLTRSGQFKLTPVAGAASDESAKPDAAAWRQAGAEYVLLGSVSKLADGRLDVRYRLWDAIRSQELLSDSVQGTEREHRMMSHRISDAVYEKLTGVRGAFATRIAYVTKSPRLHQLWVADADGENALTPLDSKEPIISPAWSPSGTQLAYVSFEQKKPVVYVQEIITGVRRVVANFKGSNSAPAWAPDGKSLVVTLSRDGNSQLYRLDVAGGSPVRLSRSDGIDTEAVFSSDGAQIYFVSDRGGSPQIYSMPAAGGPTNRVTYAGTYNISPSLSPDGRWMAYISRINGQFKLHVMDLGTGVTTAITDTTADESPSFSPNGRLLLYATRIQGREVLMTTTLDGQVKARLSADHGAIREPDWGPYMAGISRK